MTEGILASRVARETPEHFKTNVGTYVHRVFGDGIQAAVRPAFMTVLGRPGAAGETATIEGAAEFPLHLLTLPDLQEQVNQLILDASLALDQAACRLVTPNNGGDDWEQALRVGRKMLGRTDIVWVSGPDTGHAIMEAGLNRRPVAAEALVPKLQPNFSLMGNPYYYREGIPEDGAYGFKVKAGNIWFPHPMQVSLDLREDPQMASHDDKGGLLLSLHFTREVGITLHGPRLARRVSLAS
jgi:hypothetical protein